MVAGVETMALDSKQFARTPSAGIVATTPIGRIEPPPIHLGELIDFVAPEFRSRYQQNCPPWPPDVFAVTATLLRRTGGYVRTVELLRP